MYYKRRKMARLLGKALQILQRAVTSQKEELEKVEPINDDGKKHACEECGFVAKSRIGLIGHSKAHEKKDGE